MLACLSLPHIPHKPQTCYRAISKDIPEDIMTDCKSHFKHGGDTYEKKTKGICSFFIYGIIPKLMTKKRVSSSCKSSQCGLYTDPISHLTSSEHMSSQTLMNAVPKNKRHRAYLALTICGHLDVLRQPVTSITCIVYIHYILILHSFLLLFYFFLFKIFLSTCLHTLIQYLF